MIAINVTPTEKELFDFNYYTSWKAPWNKKKKISWYARVMLYTVVGLAIFFYIVNAKLTWEAAISGVAVLTIYFGIIVPFYIKYRYQKTVKKFYKDPKNENIVLPNQIIINENGIFTRDSASETTYKWNAIVRKSVYNGCTYLYLSNVQALIIPDRVFTGKDEKEEFEKMIVSQLLLKATLSDLK